MATITPDLSAIKAWKETTHQPKHMPEMLEVPYAPTNEIQIILRVLNDLGRAWEDFGKALHQKLYPTSMTAKQIAPMPASYDMEIAQIVMHTPSWGSCPHHGAHMINMLTCEKQCTLPLSMTPFVGDDDIVHDALTDTMCGRHAEGHYTEDGAFYCVFL